MQTALARAINPTSHTTTDVRLIFDTGSYRSYISEDLARQLLLATDDTKDLNITTFRSDDVHHLKAHTASLTLLMRNDKPLNVTITVVPTITGTIT